MTNRMMFSRLNYIGSSLIILLLFIYFTSMVLSLSYQRHSLMKMSSSTTGKLIVGLNKYSHDSSCAIIDLSNGKLLFSQAKERISGKKHDGGGVGDLMRYALKSIGATKEDISIVVSNNHHFRVLPFEKRIPFYVSLNYIPKNYADPYNLLKEAKHLELSHHLAHAYSAMYTSPYSNGLILVMDGMGESFRAMSESVSDQKDDMNSKYMNDLKIIKQQKNENFVGQPTILQYGSGYREAESAYYFDKDKLVPVFKRWSRERSPPELYNSGFENHESLGAVYSRISSHILGDWNSCGKIMGLAPWANKQRVDAKSWLFQKYRLPELELGDHFYHKQQLMTGNPYDGDSFHIHWDVLDTLPNPNQWSEKRFGYLANLANNIQENLEDSAMQLVSSLRQTIATDNLILTGGVALNSVLNGKITNSYNHNGNSNSNEGFRNVYVPPAPGDEGIAIGCAYYGYQTWLKEQGFDKSEGKIESIKSQSQLFDFFTNNVDLSKEIESASIDINGIVAPVVAPSFSPYLGKAYSNQEIQEALLDYSAWITFTRYENMDTLIDTAVDDITSGHIIAWYQGRSELGQRALGARSILADPRIESNRQIINEKVKEREWYRPLAPSVLEEYVSEWFVPVSPFTTSMDSIFRPMTDSIKSPYMSITAMVRQDKQSKVPAICHIDGSARLQTVSLPSGKNIDSTTDHKSAGNLYYKLISAFYKKTGVPMVLNTSFNRKGEPIVETPYQAIKSFLECKGYLSTLYMGEWKVEKRPFPILLLEEKMSQKESRMGKEIETAASEGKLLISSSTVIDYREESIRARKMVKSIATIEREKKLTSILSDLKVAANPVYLYEVTTSVSNPNHPIRIRIQNGGNGVDMSSNLSDISSDNEESDDIWVNLPTNLHLEILQLLQNTATVTMMEEEEEEEERRKRENNSKSNSNSNRNGRSEYKSPEIEYEGSISALELLEALNTVYIDDVADKVSLHRFIQALKDLYDMQLIYFENDMDENEEDVDLVDFFKDIDIIDMRN